MWYLILAAAGTLAAQETGEIPRPPKLWNVSMAAYGAASAMDSQSSWRGAEQNPLLRSAGGEFGGRGLAIKSAVSAGWLLGQWLVVKKGASPKVVKALTVVNFAVAGMTAGVAVRNHGRRARGEVMIIRRP